MVNAIYEKGNTVNIDTFRVFGVVFQKRDLLFLYATAAITDQPEVEGDLWTVTYHFSAVKALVDFVINKDIKVPLKAGWDWLEVLYNPQADTEIGKLVPVAYGYKVIRVYEEVSGMAESKSR